MRQPIVAGRFYPDNPQEMQQTLARLIPHASQEEKINAKAVIIPHAGYVYSGGVAGITISKVNVPETVVILGPNHHGRGALVALSTDDWQMPMGKVPADSDLAGEILKSSARITADETAHAFEHSLEVQVPFLQHEQKDLHIVPICVGHLSYEECQLVAQDLSSAIQAARKDVLLVASTDMTHYKSREEATKQDTLAIEHILRFDPKGLYATIHKYQISMCGVIPTTITLLTAKALGARKVELIQYTDSGDVSGDISQVVGYAGLVVK